MKILFILCEGQHDAQFLYRLLCASGQYENPKWLVEDYPKPFPKFFETNFQRQNVGSMIIGSPTAIHVPQVSLKHKEDDLLILVYTLGGQNKVVFTKKLLKKIFNLLPHDDSEIALYSDQGALNSYSLLFFFDADEEGREKTLSDFKKNYEDIFGNLNDLEVEKWVSKENVPLGVFIFTGDDGETGTLEDTLIHLFIEQNKDIVTDSFKLLDTYSDHKIDKVAQKAKRSKSALTICGQAEKDRAGASLAIVVRHSKLLDNAFDFSDENTQWSRILTMINLSFFDEDG